MEDGGSVSEVEVRLRRSCSAKPRQLGAWRKHQADVAGLAVFGTYWYLRVLHSLCALRAAASYRFSLLPAWSLYSPANHDLFAAELHDIICDHTRSRPYWMTPSPSHTECTQYPIVGANLHPELPYQLHHGSIHRPPR